MLCSHYSYTFTHAPTELSLLPCVPHSRVRLEALNVAWTNMSRGALVYLVICVPPSLIKLNLSGCRETLEDEGEQIFCLLLICEFFSW